MPYAMAQPPFTLKFHKMNRKELAEYNFWFFHVMPERLHELAGAVRETAGFTEWSADLTPNSLENLGNWFAGEVGTRPRSADEIEEITGRSEFKISISQQELTNRTFSLAMDTGMYLGETLKKQYPRLEWRQPLDDPQSVDYGQPVLVGFGPAPLNPVQVAVVFAYGVAKGTRTGSGLGEIYATWSKRALAARD